MECCNCGCDLKKSLYTLSWEDRDNEYGYWICSNCGTENIDWSSGDDD